jgi:hypothetical protein
VETGVWSLCIQVAPTSLFTPERFKTGLSLQGLLRSRFISLALVEERVYRIAVDRKAVTAVAAVMQPANLL